MVAGKKSKAPTCRHTTHKVNDVADSGCIFFFGGGTATDVRRFNKKHKAYVFHPFLLSSSNILVLSCSGLAADITDDVLWPGKQEIQCAVECAASTLRRTLPGVHREVETTPVLEVGLSGFN